MFAKDLCHSQIEYFRNAIDLDRKDRAKRYHKSSIFNSGLSGLGLLGLGRFQALIYGPGQPLQILFQPTVKLQDG